jgi:acetyl-CoA carboxylase alpha subunit
VAKREASGNRARKKPVLFLGGQRAWDNHEELARQLGLTPPAVSLSVRRGEELVKKFGYRLTGE